MRHFASLIALAFLVPACGPTDADGDGVPATLDCDDADYAVYPGANEVCDGKDNDCNQIVDDDYAKGGKIFFLDRDGDGFGVWEQAKVQCTAPQGYVDNSDDCADDDETIFPGAPEFCDKIDQDCDNQVDEDAVDAVAYYSDFDQDGYGGEDQAERRCEQPDGFITQGGDCNDFDQYVNPEAEERCDLEDNNCNGIIDEGASLDATTWYADKDRDGFGDPEDTIDACYQPEYYQPEELASDCDDTNDAVNPGVTERCFNGIDDNCDGSANACSFEGWTSHEDAAVEVTGPSSSGYLGRDLDFVGDFNGDGFTDMVFGGYRSTGSVCSSAGNSWCGGTFVLFGGEDLDSTYTSSDLLEFGAATRYDYMGIAVEGAGDLDGDGFDDIAMGAYSHDDYTSSAGAVYIAYGSPDWSMGNAYDGDESLALFFGGSSSAYLGYSLAGPGDLDGDGFDDLMMAAYRADYDPADYGGAVYMLYGSKSRATFGAAAELPTLTAVDRYDYLGGYSGNALGGGDFDGDGLVDMAAGAYCADPRGRSCGGSAWLVYGDGSRLSGTASIGDVADARINGENSSEYIGASVGSVGDINGDGYADMYVGGPRASSFNGACGIFFGGTERLDGEYVLSDAGLLVEGAQSYSYLCQNGASGSDLDNDGINELIVGGYGHDQTDLSLYDNGLVMIFKGSSELSGEVSSEDADAVLRHDTRYTRFGSGASSHQGDVNGDGYGDVLIGADGVNSYAGAGYLYLGVGM